MSPMAKTLHKILRLKQLKEKTGLSGSSVYNKLNPRSKYYDETFPKPIRLGATSISGSVGWIESEIEAWLASRPRTRLIEKMEAQ